jgi:hypothetical protein
MEVALRKDGRGNSAMKRYLRFEEESTKGSSPPG